MDEKKQVWVWVAYIGLALTVMLFLLMLCLYYLGVSTPQLKAYVEDRHTTNVVALTSFGQNFEQNFTGEIENLVGIAKNIQATSIERKAEYDRLVAERKAELAAIAAAEAAALAAAEAEAAALAARQNRLFTSEILLSTKGEHDLVYYNQTEDPWKDAEYAMGNRMGPYGCGPTVLSMVFSTFLQEDIIPTDMAAWSYANGYFAPNSGSYHDLIPAGAEAFGLHSTSLVRPTADELISELEHGNLIVVLMSSGTFSNAGHFIVLRDVTEDGMILIGDSQSLAYSQTPWDPQVILNEAKYYASAGGPFWSISLP